MTDETRQTLESIADGNQTGSEIPVTKKSKWPKFLPKRIKLSVLIGIVALSTMGIWYNTLPGVKSDRLAESYIKQVKSGYMQPISLFKILESDTLS